MHPASPGRSRRRLSPLLTWAAFAVTISLCLTVTMATAKAADPTTTASPTAEAGPSASDDPAATPDPGATPGATPGPDPASPEPTTTPDASPSPSDAAVPSESPVPGESPEPSTAPSDSPAPDLASVLHVDHVWIDVLDAESGLRLGGTLDAPASGIERGRIYAVRFRLVNDTAAPVTVRPLMEFGAGTGPTSWSVVPAVDPRAGVAFYTSANLRAAERPAAAAIAIEELRLSDSANPLDVGATGTALAGLNPGPALTLAPPTFTEVAFTVRATASAAWRATYGLRLTDDGRSIAGSVARLVMGARPDVRLSAGQHVGSPVAPPVVYAPASSTTAAGPQAPFGPTTESIHGQYALTSDLCAACHTTHRAASTTLLNQVAPQAGLCFTCHSAGGGAADIEAQYTDPAVPSNNPGAAEYYVHPATELSSHVSDQGTSEFAGVLNRHAACADCHQPHLADGTPAVETSGGWTSSGALFGASGVSVVNGAAGDPPAYTRTATTTFEYQLCFKCHSGYTTLPAPSGGPSTWALDKAIELNPANVSYHPVEAPGTNTTPAMDVSLGGDPVYGSSPYKLWNLTSGSTVRCVSCHGDARLADPNNPPDAGAVLAPHAVENRGMLIANLRDRTLNSGAVGEPVYAAADFALCYVCHAEYPFVDTSMSATPSSNFALHGYHVSGLHVTSSEADFPGPAGSVDTDGAGGGNAICAECHFRTHGTAFAVDGQPAWGRLVNFSPNVQPYLGTLAWNQTSRTCTLTCHGVEHDAWPMDP